MSKTYFEKKILNPVMQVLRQGISPEKISLSIAWGVAIGIFPVVGTTTLLCMAAALILRLNLPIIQIANWLVYPLQLVLILPFFFAGAYVFGSDPSFTQNAQEIILLFQSDLIGAIILMKGVILNAILVWFCTAPVVIIVLYRFLTPMLRSIQVHRCSAMDSDRKGFANGQNNTPFARRIS